MSLMVLIHSVYEKPVFEKKNSPFNPGRVTLVLIWYSTKWVTDFQTALYLAWLARPWLYWLMMLCSCSRVTESLMTEKDWLLDRVCGPGFPSWHEVSTGLWAGDVLGWLGGGLLDGKGSLEDWLEEEDSVSELFSWCSLICVLDMFCSLRFVGMMLREVSALGWLMLAGTVDEIGGESWCPASDGWWDFSCPVVSEEKERMRVSVKQVDYECIEVWDSLVEGQQYLRRFDLYPRYLGGLGKEPRHEMNQICKCLLCQRDQLTLVVWINSLWGLDCSFLLGE